MSLDFNVDPYFDDYEENKQFYKILFKPRRAVQARELNQMQTILQKQISRLGSHIFKEGSIVSGAETRIDDSSYYIKCKATYSGNIVNFLDLEGKYVFENTTGKVGLVKKVILAAGGDPATLFVSIISGQQTKFDNNSLFTVYNERDLLTASKYFESEASDASGVSLLFHVSEGVFFAKETFLYCPPQTVVVGKYSKTEDYIAGLTITESIVDSNDDQTLLDPAVGTTNYFAPGADRYKIELALTTKPYSNESVAYEDFIELVRVKNNVKQVDNRIPIYSVLGDTLARRTYDESGDYIVRNFFPSIQEDPSSNSKLILEISEGKAYVRGYEIETVAPTTLSLDKARETNSEVEYEVGTYYGNYVYVNSLTGLIPTFSTYYQVEIHNVTSSWSAETQIGTAYIKNIDYYSGTGDDAVFAMFLLNINISSSTFTKAKSFVVRSGSSYTNLSFTAIINNQSIINNDTILSEPNFDTLVFPVPVSHVSSVSGVEYYYKQRFTTTASSGQLAITCSASDDFVSVSTPAAYRQHFTLINQSTGNFIPIDEGGISISVASNLATITLNTSAYDGDTFHVLATVRTSSGTTRTKTLTSATSLITVSGTTPTSLLKSDLYAVNYIYELTSSQTYIGTWSAGTTYSINDVVIYNSIAYTSLTSSNTGNTPTTSITDWSAITNSRSSYTFNTGQRDTYYDHGSVTRNFASISSFSALVLFQYFTHSGTGHLSVNSYPIDYALIPTFTSRVTGETYELTDVLDFRPRRVDDTASFELPTHYIPQPFENTIIDFSFYLRRVDIVILTSEGKFKVIKGVPSLYSPKPPSGEDKSITLFVLTYQPYIETVRDVSIQILPYKRYTMKDIAKLDDRITRVEYYTSLSLLEKEISNKTFTDEYGSQLFNNGFLVDTFQSFNVADVKSPDFQASLDFTNSTLRPLNVTENLTFNLNANANSNAFVSISGLVTVPYDEVTFLNISQASKAISVNPFNVVNFVGRLSLTPESDVWYDTTTLPEVIINQEGQSDNFEGFSSLETVWNSWETFWTGEKLIEGSQTTTSAGGRQVTRATYEVTTIQNRTGIETLKAPPSVILNETDRFVNQSAILYARSKNIDFEVHGLSPNTRIFLYINGKNMSGFLYPSNYINSGFNHSTPSPGLFSDGNGSASGVIVFPNTDSIKFLSGKQSIVLSDNAYDYRDSSSFAEAFFYSQGTYNTQQKTIVSTRGDYIVRRSLTDTRKDIITVVKEVANTAIQVDTTPNATYSLSVNSTQVREGDTVSFVLTAQNSPPGKSFIGNIAGSISSGDIGITPGNVILTTSGTRAVNYAYLNVPITAGDAFENDEFLTLEVDIPYDESQPKLGGPLKLTTNVRVIDSAIETYSVTAPPTIREGNILSMVFSGANLKSNANVTYTVVSSYSEANASLSNAVTGSFNIVKPANSHTLNFSMLEDNIYEADETFSVMFVWDRGNLRSNVTIINKDNPVYVVGAPSTVNEGGTVYFSIDTHNVLAGNVVPYTITGISAGDLSYGSLTGNVIIGSTGRGQVVITLKEDLTTEGDEQLMFKLGFDYPNDSSCNVKVLDTSKREAYGIRVEGGSIVTENSNVIFVVTTSGVASGTVVPYTITGVTSADISAGSGDVATGYLTGNITIGSNGTGYAYVFVAKDASVENETMTIQLFASGNQNFLTRDVKIIDVGTEVYAVNSDRGSYNEGDTIRFTLSTTNVPTGNTVAYTVTGISSGDIVSGSLSGTMTINSLGTSFIDLVLKNDALTEGTEIATITVVPPDNNNVTKSVSIIDSSTASAVYGAGFTVNTSEGIAEPGDVINIAVVGYNVQSGNVVPYTISGVTNLAILPSQTLTGNIYLRTAGEVGSFIGSDSFTLNKDYAYGGVSNVVITFNAFTGLNPLVIPFRDTPTNVVWYMQIIDNDLKNTGIDTFNRNEDNSDFIIMVNGRSLPNYVINLPFTISGVSLSDFSNVYIRHANSSDTGYEEIQLTSLSGTIRKGVKNPDCQFYFVGVKPDGVTEGTETMSLTVTLPAGSSPSTLNTSVKILDTSVGGINYSLISSSTVVREGDQIYFLVETKDAALGNVIPFTITGVTSADFNLVNTVGFKDFDTSALRGNLEIISRDSIPNSAVKALGDINKKRTAYAIVQTIKDTASETEVLSFGIPALLSGAPAFANVSVLDSLPEPTFSIDSDKSIVSEGDKVTFNLVSKNAIPGTEINWRTSGNAIFSDLGNPTASAGDSRNLSGIFIVGQKESETFTIASDGILESPEDLTMSIVKYSSPTDYYTYASRTITLVDSTPVYYTVETDSLIYKEGDRATFTIKATNLPANKNYLPSNWNKVVVLPQMPGEFLYVATGNSNSFVVTLDAYGVGKVNIDFASDKLTEGEEDFYLNVYSYVNITNGISIPSLESYKVAQSKVKVLDTSNSTVGFNITGPTQVIEGDTLNFKITTDSSETLVAKWRIRNDAGNFRNSYLVSSQQFITGTPGQPDWGTYVRANDDLFSYWYDAYYLTDTYIQKYPNSQTAADIIAAKANNTYLDWPGVKAVRNKLGNIEESQSAWGELHWNTYGKNVDHYVLPVYGAVSGTVFVSSATPGLVTLNVAKDYRATGDNTIYFEIYEYDKSSTLGGTPSPVLPNPVSLGSKYSHKVVIQDTSKPVVVSIDPVSKKLSGTGDFLDSSKTIGDVVREYYNTDGKTTAQIQSEGSGKIIAPSSLAGRLSTIANTVRGWYQSLINRNPELEGLIYWVNDVVRNISSTVVETSPAWFSRNTSRQSSFFGANYGVWVNSSGTGTKAVRKRLVTIPSIGKDRRIVCVIESEWILYVYMSKEINNRGIYVGSGTGGGVSFQNSGLGIVTLDLEPGTYIVTFDYFWANSVYYEGEQPVDDYFAVAFYNVPSTQSISTGIPRNYTPFWDTRTYAASENIHTSTPLTESEALAKSYASAQIVAAQNYGPPGTRSSFLACTTDPVAQTFFIDKTVHPDGVFLTGVNLFFRSKDEVLPVFAEIRSTVNGYPSSTQVVPLTTIFKRPPDVVVSEDASVPTLFEFNNPVYFAPGEYAIIVGSNSEKYTVYVAGVGETQIGTNNIISSQPYVGSLFKSQNASTWTPEQNEDLTFQLKRANFYTNNTYFAVFESNALVKNADYHVIKLVSEELDFDSKTDINYGIKYSENSVLDANYANIISNRNVEIGTTKTANVKGDLYVRVGLSTTSSDISPVIDTERLNAVIVKNIINNAGNVVIPETAPLGGSALAKYVTRRVTLADGFDATGLRVIMDVNRPAGTDIKVYYKIISSEETDDFDDIYYQELPLLPKPKQFTGSDDFIINEYKKDAVSYVSNGTYYNTFKTFAIKVVMYSNNPAIVPKIKNLRVVATS